MDDLAEQIVQHFPTEDKVLTNNNEIHKGGKFFKDLFSNLCRNPGIIVMVAAHAVALFMVFIAYVEKWPNKPTTHLLQHIQLTQMRMMMKNNL